MKIWAYIAAPSFLFLFVGMALGPKSVVGRAAMNLAAIYGGLILLLLFLFVIWGTFAAAKGATQMAKAAIAEERKTGRIREFFSSVLAMVWYVIVVIAILLWLSGAFSDNYDPDNDPSDYYRGRP